MVDSVVRHDCCDIYVQSFLPIRTSIMREACMEHLNKMLGVYSGLHALESYSGHRSTVFAMSYGMFFIF